MSSRNITAAALFIAMIATSPAIARRTAGLHVAVPYGGIWGQPVRVYYPPDPFQPLNLRFAWTQVEAARHHDRDAWIAYQCRSVFAPNQAYGTEAPSIDRPQDAQRGVMLHSSRDRFRQPDAPDLVILLRVHATPQDQWSVVWAAARTPSLEIEPGHLPVYWIGAGDVEESIALLDWLDRSAASPEAREQLVNVVAVHRDSAATVSHLTRLLSQDPPENVRVAVGAALARHSPPTTLGRLAGPDRPKDAGR